MRVAVVHNLPRGGARRRLENQLSSLEHDVTEICLDTATPITSDATVVPFAPVAPRVRPSMRPPLRYADLALLVGAWRRAGAAVQASRPDVVFVNPCRFLQAPPILLRRGLPPSVYFCDEARRYDYEPDAKASTNRLTRVPYAPLRAIERTLDRAALARATIVLTNSRHTAGRIHDAYGQVAQAVPLGVSDFFRPTGASRGDHVLSVGTLIPGKGHDIVLAGVAGAQISHPVMIVAPRPDPEAERALRDQAAALGIELDIRIGVTDSDLRLAYERAFCTVYMARNEPLGLASMEAQACGCPVLVAAEGGLPETIDDGVSGLAIRRDPQSLAAALDRLAVGDSRSRMSEAAVRHGAAFSWRRSSESVSDAFARAVSIASSGATIPAAD